MARMRRILATINAGRKYKVGVEEIAALDGVNLEIFPGQFVAVVGRSGSGKTTLLNLMAGLDMATTGSVLFEEQDFSQMNENELVDIRRHKIGFVFQSFGLIPLLSAFENVELPLRISGVGMRERESRAKKALETVELTHRSRHRPYELSGGEQQRVAIARAMVTRPSLILADEPTGELDSVNADSIFRLFAKMVKSHAVSVVIATHDSTLLDMADEILEMRDGRLVGNAHE